MSDECNKNSEACSEALKHPDGNILCVDYEFIIN